MTVDIRANVTCSLGTLISGNISDDYIQGSGLVKTKGYCEVVGLHSPAIGTPVTFSFTKNGLTRRIPRQLLVLSSFADPFRRTTKVELGCRLTYLQDLKEPVRWEWYDDDENNDKTKDDAAIVTIPISASSVMRKCLTELGITASSVPLTNRFSIAEFDFSSGYVDVLSNLLVSECYFGYINDQGVLQVLSLDQEGGTGPVLSSSNVIDIGPIGVGALPGEAVTVSYSTLKLKQPEGSQPEGSDGDGNSSNSSVTKTTNEYVVLISYTAPNGSQASVAYPVLETSEVTTNYGYIDTRNSGTVGVVISRLTNTTISAAAAVGNYMSALLSAGVPVGNITLAKNTVESFSYDRNANETFRSSTTTASQAIAVGESPLPLVFANYYVNLVNNVDYTISAVTVETSRVGNYSQSVTRTYGSWLRTIAGQQALAEARDSFTTSQQVLPYLEQLRTSNCLLSVTTENNLSSYDGERVPSQAERTNAFNADKTGDPNNGYRTESKSELVLSSGTEGAKRRVEFTMPYAPDDVFIKAGTTFSAVKSDADAKAKKFGLVQNRLLLGNRSGMNVQSAPEFIPAAPFSPFFVVGNGFAALYRTNGTSWTMDSSGVVASTDGLYWGISGKAS